MQKGGWSLAAFLLFARGCSEPFRLSAAGCPFPDVGSTLAVSHNFRQSLLSSIAPTTFGDALIKSFYLP
jgi:hypothetical protein